MITPCRLILESQILQRLRLSIGIVTWNCYLDWRWRVQESWYEKLNRWEEALKAYDAKREESQPGSPQHLEASMGRLRWN